MDQDRKDYIEPEERRRRRLTLLEVIFIVAGVVVLVVVFAFVVLEVAKFYEAMTGQ